MAVTPVVLRNATDTYDSEVNPSKNFYVSNTLIIRLGGTGDAFAYLFFNRPFPLGVTVLSAELTLYGSGAWPALSRTLEAKRISSTWSSATETYNTRPTVLGEGVEVNKTAALADGEPWVFDVQAQMQAVSDGDTWYGWRIDTTESTGRAIYSAGSPDNKPTLEVSWSDQPAAPSTLAPSGDRVVSVASPVLRFDFTDDAGDTTLAAVQVQINPTNVWTAPAFDSGEVATTSPQLDLSTTAYAGLGLGASTFWRVRVKDGAGLFSEWSDAAQFSRLAQGTLFITNPAADPNDFVSEPTPPISWSLSGTTQGAFQVIITDTVTLSNRIYDSGRRTSTENSHTLPADVITDTGATYRVVVRVWDDEDRETTPGDQSYVEASREFTFAESATVAPVVGLTATPDAPRPWMTLEWTRSTAPDSYTILRDGRVVESGLDPADLLVSGTSYEFADRFAHPRRDVTWTVQAVVNGVTSDVNPTATSQTVPVGVWLCDATRETTVCIVGAEEGTWAMGELSEAHAVTGSPKVTLITQSLRGYEGSVSGLLVTDIFGIEGVSAQEWRDRVFDLKRRPGQTLVLTLQDMAIPVVVRNVVVYPTPSVPLEFKVSFDFYQVGNIPFEVLL